MTRRAQPRPIAESVRVVRARSEPATLMAAIQGCWLEALGERVAAEARPIRERDGVVTVECRAATWAQELDLMQDELVERLNSALGEPRVAGLRLIVGDGRPHDPQ